MGKINTTITNTPYLDLAAEGYQYLEDRSQRAVLFWDIMRKRGNIYLEHLEDGQPPILLFQSELVLDGRSFERPVNYSLVRISDRRLDQPALDAGKGATCPTADRRRFRDGNIVDSDGLPARPIVVIDPRAGHGPGIGGSKMSSQVGIALEYGHPVYFVSFTTDPEPGQTISDVHAAEVRFLEEVARRHPHAPKAAVIGNCQAGWAAALIGSDRPDVTGPMVFNGSPLSYWGGVEGANPMRYRGGLIGGIWMTSLLCDLGNDTFDGANLVANFEDLNPANTWWSKYYNLYSKVDTEEQRFLDFEKWWGGFFKMNTEEIHFIVNGLFIGNELEKGHLKLDNGRIIDLRNSEDPILAFASEGDNITPPPQALNWIYKVYGTAAEIKRCGQVIIYMIHDRVGHLGIFVSGGVAKREHNQILGNMGWLDYFPPGLYEMIIDEDPAEGGAKDSYLVRFEEREMEDILSLDDGLEDEIPFSVVNAISRYNDAMYRSYLSPLVKALVTEKSAEMMRQLHPLRVQRYTVSDQNPACLPLSWMGDYVKTTRKPVAADNFFLRWEEIMAKSIVDGLNYYRDVRDLLQEQLFKSIYDTFWMKELYGEFEISLREEEQADEARLRFERWVKRQRLRRQAEDGGFVEACIRVMYLVAGADRILDVREFRTAEKIIRGSRRLSRISPEQYQKISRQQTKILNTIPLKAITSLGSLVTDLADQQKVLGIAREMAGADGILTSHEGKMLRILEKVFSKAV